MALDLFAVFFGGAIALLPLFATDILHVGPVGPRRAADGAVGRRPARHADRDAPAAEPPRRRDAPHLRRRLRVSMIVFGLSTTFWLSLAALFMSGVTDGISMIIRRRSCGSCRRIGIRGRVSSVNWVFIGASNELGAFESGVAARLFGTVPSVVGGAS